MAISYGRTDIETPIHADIKETISHGPTDEFSRDK